MDGNGKPHRPRVTKAAICIGDHGGTPYCFAVFYEGEWNNTDTVTWAMIAQDPKVEKVYAYCKKHIPPEFHL